MIIDAGALGDSGLLSDAMGLATDLIIVVRLHADTVPNALAVCSAAAAIEVPLIAACTLMPWRPFGSGRLWARHWISANAERSARHAAGGDPRQ